MVIIITNIQKVYIPKQRESESLASTTFHLHMFYLLRTILYYSGILVERKPSLLPSTKQTRCREEGPEFGTTVPHREGLDGFRLANRKRHGASLGTQGKLMFECVDLNTFYLDWLTF